MSWMIAVDGQEEQLKWIRQVVTALIADQEAVVNLNGFSRIQLEMLLAGAMALLAGHAHWVSMGSERTPLDLWSDFCLALEQMAD